MKHIETETSEDQGFGLVYDRDFHDQIRSMMKVQKNKTSSIYKQNVLKGI